MKTLLQINSVVNTGSTGRIAEEIGQTALATGWNSIIAYGRNDRKSISKKIRIGNDWAVKWHGLETRLIDNHGFASRSATKHLISQLREIKPDIIHLHNVHGYYLNIHVLFNFFKEYNGHVIWTLHDCWPFTGHCTYFDFAGCEKWKTECYSCPQKGEYPSSLFIDRSRTNYQLKKGLFTSLENLTLVPVSNWLGRLLKESFLKNYPIRTIHNGINTDIFKPIENKIKRTQLGLENKFVILGVANVWSLRKGLQDFIELNSLLDDKFQIILIGLSKKQLKSIPSNILGLERTESVEALAEFYSMADVFVNPTYEDNFPTTNLEALACGTPVITYNTGGSPEAIDQHTGIVVEKGNITDLVLALKTIQLNDKEFFSYACRNRALEKFRKEERFAEYLSLYNSLL